MKHEPIDIPAELGVAPEQLPRHVAIIMDGNGRWAKQRQLPRIRGHEQGAQTVRKIVTHCARLKLDALTLYSFSAENWRRPRQEVDFLMELYKHYLAAERDEIIDNDVRLVQVGRRKGLPDNVLEEMDRTIAMSRGNKGLTLCLALNYGSRTEIVDAVRTVARRVLDGKLSIDRIDEDEISNSLYTAGLPDPDLMIRTAGERRMSNFLLWQLSYAELYVCDAYWPDFTEDHFNAALKDFAHRERRFGGVEPVKT